MVRAESLNVGGTRRKRRLAMSVADAGMPRFGTFKIRQRKTRMARNPRTGSPVEVSARPVPVFKPSKELRAMVADLTVSELAEAESFDD